MIVSRLYIAGALATHADDVIRKLTPPQQRLARTLFLRLITSDGTREVVEVQELCQLDTDPAQVRQLVDHLMAARLLVVQSRGADEGSAVEIVHESLTNSWPTLRRWLDESSEDNAFLEQLRAAAKQWQARDRARGLLWRGDAMDEARRFAHRYQAELPVREREFLDSVIQEGRRAGRMRRRMISGAFVILLGVVAAGAVALVLIRGAEQTAQDQRVKAEQQTERVEKARTQIESQLTTITEQKTTIRRKENQRKVATDKADRAEKQVKTGARKLAMTYAELEAALEKTRKQQRRAEREQKKATQSATAEREAKNKFQKLFVKERARTRRLEEEKWKLSTKLR